MSTAKTFALSYDDGPSQWTPGILEHLTRWGGHATFFHLGEVAAAHQNVLRAVIAQGSEVCNHGWSHTPMTKLDSDALKKEFEDTRAALEAATGEPLPTLWRPPYHNRDARVMEVSRGLGLRRVGTDNDPGDYGDEIERIFSYVTAKLRPGSIVNLHDGIPPCGSSGWDHRQNTVIATGQILEWAAERGWRSVTVSELLAEHGGTHPLVTDEH